MKKLEMLTEAQTQGVGKQLFAAKKKPIEDIIDIDTKITAREAKQNPVSTKLAQERFANMVNQGFIPTRVANTVFLHKIDNGQAKFDVVSADKPYAFGTAYLFFLASVTKEGATSAMTVIGSGDRLDALKQFFAGMLQEETPQEGIHVLTFDLTAMTRPIQ